VKGYTSFGFPKEQKNLKKNQRNRQTDMLNPHSPVPLYHQLSELLMDKIRNSEYLPGQRIPSEHRLAETYSIGRPTVRHALERLVQRGLLIRKRGSGTFVNAVRREIDLFSLGGTLSAFYKKGLSIKVQIVRPMTLVSVKKNTVNPFSEKSAFFITRLTRVDDSPVLIETLYFHAGIFKGIDAIDLDDRSLSEVVREKFFMMPVGGRQNFRIGYPSKNQAILLEVSTKTPILAVKRFLHFSQSKNAVFSELFCRTDRFVFSQQMEGTTNA
jgi:GntR family transcriptional regulator